MRLDWSVNKLEYKRVTAADIRAASSSSEQNGLFSHNGQWNQNAGVLTVRFSPTILLNKALGEAERAEVKKHEDKHFTDFKVQAERMKSGIDGAIKRHQDPRMEDRWAWFNYDVDQASNAYHRRTGRVPKIVFPPSSPRPP